MKASAYSNFSTYRSSDFMMPKKFSAIALSKLFPFQDILCMIPWSLRRLW